MKTCLVSVISYRHMPVKAVGCIMNLNYIVKHQLIDYIEGKITPEDFENKAFIPDVYIGGDDALVGRARSMIMQYFLNNNYDYGIFVDQDIVWQTGHLKKIYDRLHSGKYQIIGANYATKHGETLHKCYSASRPEFGSTIQYHKDAEPIEIKWLAGGCFGVTREAVLKIINHHKLKPLHNGAFYPLFETKVTSNPMNNNYDYYLSEDYYFCELAKEAGIKIWLDPSIYDLGHIGEFNYHLADSKVLHVRANDFSITEKAVER